MKKILLLIGSCLLINSSTLAQVGMRDVDSNGMNITLVYPTATASQALTRGPFHIEVAMNAPLSSKAHHLIVMSHGTGGSAITDFSLASTLARAGFVVAQPEHRGDNAKDFSKAGPESWDTRPKEISETIDFFAQDKQFAKQLDLKNVGVHGMSAGGLTALIMAGGQWRMLELTKHCGAFLEEDISFCMNGLANQPLKQALRRTQFKAAFNASEKWLPESIKALHGAPSPAAESNEPRPDLRVVAVSALVPLSAVFTDDSLARIKIPVGLTSASRDEVLSPKFHVEKVLRHCSSCKLLSNAPLAGHFDWLAPWPTELAQKIGAQQLRGGEVHSDFTSELRQSSFDRIADFFIQTLK